MRKLEPQQAGQSPLLDRAHVASWSEASQLSCERSGRWRHEALVDTLQVPLASPGVARPVLRLVRATHQLHPPTWKYRR